MRFLTLKDQTVLPVERIRHQFRNEEVRSVLPARLAGGTSDTLLVATTSALAIVTGVPGSPRRWLTRWAPWDAVHFGGRIETRHQRGHDVHHLAVRVDRLRFESYLPGRIGLRAMRDFVDASRARQTEVALSWAALTPVRAGSHRVLSSPIPPFGVEIGAVAPYAPDQG